MKTIQIKEGVRLHLIPDAKFTTFRAEAMFHRPLCREEVTKNQLLCLMLRRGGKKYPTPQAVSIRSEELFGTSLYSYATRRGEDQIVAIGIDAIADNRIKSGEKNLEGSFDLLFDSLFGHFEDDFDDAELSIEKETLKNRIESDKNNKVSYSVTRLIEEMFRGEPYGVNPSGYGEDIAAISAAELSEHYRRILNGSALDIVVAGNFDEADAVRCVKAGFDRLDGRCGKIYETTIKSDVGDVKRVTDEMDVTQGKLCIGFRADVSPLSDDDYAMWMFSTVFGGTPSSKLFNNVREKLSLCYYASSSYDRQKACVTVRSGIEFENFDRAYDEIFVQLNDIKEGKISDEELLAAQKAVENGLRSQRDSLGGIIGYYVGGIVMGEDRDIERDVKKLLTVTKEDIADAAKKLKLDTVYFLTGKGEAK